MKPITCDAFAISTGLPCCNVVSVDGERCSQHRGRDVAVQMEGVWADPSDPIVRLIAAVLRRVDLLDLSVRSSEVGRRFRIPLAPLQDGANGVTGEPRTLEVNVSTEAPDLIVEMHMAEPAYDMGLPLIIDGHEALEVSRVLTEAVSWAERVRRAKELSAR